MTDQLALARAFTALADPTRRDIFERVARRPRAVGELAEELPVSRPAVSQHLRVLADAGLVTPRAEGTRRIYEADPQGWPASATTSTASGTVRSGRSLTAYARAAEDHHTRQEHR